MFSYVSRTTSSKYSSFEIAHVVFIMRLSRDIISEMTFSEGTIKCGYEEWGGGGGRSTNQIMGVEKLYGVLLHGMRGRAAREAVWSTASWYEREGS